MNSAFLDRLYSPDRPVIVFDGAMGTNLQVQNLSAEDFGGAEYEGCNEYLVITKPEAVQTVHRQFLEAGADVIETDTFGGSTFVLAEYGLSDRAYELNKAAAALAKGCAAEFSTPEKPRFVAGSIGPGTKLPTLGHIDYDTLKTALIPQVQGLMDGGADLLLVETCQDVLQIKAALNAIETVFAEKGTRLPLMVSVTVEQQGTMLVGSDIAAALAILEPYPITILGLNCATGPDLMSEHIKYLCEQSPFVVSCIPNAGLPENVGGQAHYRLTPLEFRMALLRFVEEWGVQVIGGCCGTRPEHIQALAEMTADLQPKRRSVRSIFNTSYSHPENNLGESEALATEFIDPRPAFNYIPAAASIYTAQPYDQDNSFLIIGERLNASGSKKVRDLLNAEDWDGLVAVAKEQMKEGAHILDVNVDYVGRDGERDMQALVSRLVTNITLPLMLDSTEWTKMEAGLKVAGGKCILNSTNYEDGDDRFFKVLDLAKQYGAGIVVGTIDEEGMARSAQKKFEIAQRAYRDALAYGIPPRELFYDPLALPISTGIEEDRVNGRETVEAIRLIQENLPGVHITLGVSNISFGLSPAARITLNSVMLHECMQVGLDSAIVSAAKILPLAKIEDHHQQVCRDLIYDRRRFDDQGICIYDPLTTLTTLFEGVTTQAARSTTALASLPIEERLKQHIIDGERIGLEEALKIGLEQYEPLHMINTFLLDGMKVVGELFGSGQMQLPFVLQSAETMKAAVAFLEPFMEKSESGDNAKGTFLIATVKGDVHDIGKNLVDIILSNNGYRVINLGIKQPVENIIAAYREHQPDCIAMSGLLVKSTAFMKDNLEIFNQEGITVPVILGGAALTPKFVNQDCQSTYKGQVIYGKDAFADLHFMDKLMPAKVQNLWDDRQGFLSESAQVADTEENSSQLAADQAEPSPRVSDAVSANAEFVEFSAPQDREESEDTTRSAFVDLNIDRPTPPFWGTQVLTPEEIPLAEVFQYLDLQALIAGQWQFRKPKEQTKEDYGAFLQETVYPILEQWKTRILEENCLQPQVIYGYFPCQSQGNHLLIYHPALMTDAAVDVPNVTQPIAVFRFPRQKANKRLCIADFFAPQETGQIDVFPMQAVTVGQIATDYANQLFGANQYTDYLYFHGMAVQTAEALAEWVHARIRRELGYGHLEPDNIRDILQQRYQGSRYSFGYPACPDIRDQLTQLQLLQTHRIGLQMDESDQLEPEQSTTAIVAYHPIAKYFNT